MRFFRRARIESARPTAADGGGLDAGRLGEVVLSFDGLTNNGGFLDSFHSYPDSLDEVVAGFELFDLPELASIIRAGIALLPGGPTPDERPEVVDDLSERAEERLEELGNRYLKVAPGDLSDRIAAFWAANPDTAPSDIPLGELPQDVVSQIADYADTLERLEALDPDRVAAHNALVTRSHELSKLLGTTEAGRAGIAALVADPRAGVRMTAAIHAFAWHEPAAVEVLRNLAAGTGFDAFRAKTFLRQHDSGAPKVN